MDMNLFAQARGLQRTLADHLNGAWADWPVGPASGKEVGLGPVGRPVPAEVHQEPRREHHVAVLVPLALADVDHLAGAVDIRLQSRGYDEIVKVEAKDREDHDYRSGKSRFSNLLRV